LYGPFTFKTGATIITDRGLFKLQVLQNRAFRLRASSTGEIFGIYELIPGRIIELADSLYTIVEIKEAHAPAPTPTPTPTVTAPPATHRNQPDTTAYTTTQPRKALPDRFRVALEWEPFGLTYYDWNVQGGDSGTSSPFERQSASILISRNHAYFQLGFVTDAEWDKTLAGDALSYQDLSIVDGQGWWVALGGSYRIFSEGCWSADVSGEVSYRQEEYTIEYSGNEVVGSSDVVVTNASDEVTTNTVYDYDFESKESDADFSEFMVMVDARLTYETPDWTLYGGIEGILYSDISFDETVEVDDTFYDLTFERTHPVSGFIGGGFFLAGFRCYAEGRAGSDTSVRLGIDRSF